METTAIITWFLGVLAIFATVGYWIGRSRARAMAVAGGERLHSRIGHHGAFVACWAIVPAFLVGFVLAILHLSSVAVPAAQVGLLACFALALTGMAVAIARIRPQLRARNAVERVIRAALLVAASVSIFVTIGIVVSILFESIRFFQLVSPWEFLTGTTWAPETAFILSQGEARAGEDMADPKFGAVPVFAGTFMITAIALFIAVPVGLFAAIYMAEYGGKKFRDTAKPLLEILAGIPTVVYGFFAVKTIAPLVVAGAESIGLDASYQNALTPGFVMGIMIIPLVSSLSDDVITSVPNAMREGSLAMGTTKSETIKKVVLPAALPGIVSAVLLAISRALGETMIVVMAAGMMANLSANPLESMTTVTVRMVSSLVGDQAFDSPQTLSAFALGLVLFVITLTLNVAATIVIRRFRQKYEL